MEVKSILSDLGWAFLVPLFFFALWGVVKVLSESFGPWNIIELR